MFDTSARILSLSLCGASDAKIMSSCEHQRQDEVKWLLKTLVERSLLEIDSEAYWTTVEGVKFLEIQFHMEQILQTQKSLV